MVGEQACGTISACLGRQGLETHGYQKPCLKMVKGRHKAYMSPGQGPRRSWPNFLQTGSVKKKKKSKAVRFTFFDRIITLLFFSINTVLTDSFQETEVSRHKESTEENIKYSEFSRLQEDISV